MGRGLRGETVPTLVVDQLRLPRNPATVHSWMQSVIETANVP